MHFLNFDGPWKLWPINSCVFYTNSSTQLASGNSSTLKYYPCLKIFILLLLDSEWGASGWYWAPKPLCERMWMSNKHRGMFETWLSAAENQNQANEVLAYWCKPWGQRSIKHLAGFQSCHGLPHQMTRLKNGRGTGAILVELTPNI